MYHSDMPRTRQQVPRFVSSIDLPRVTLPARELQEWRCCNTKCHRVLMYLDLPPGSRAVVEHECAHCGVKQGRAAA